MRVLSGLMGAGRHLLTSESANLQAVIRHLARVALVGSALVLAACGGTTTVTATRTVTVTQPVVTQPVAGGATGATLPVTVRQLDGSLIVGATVWIDGVEVRVTTDSTGIARLTELASGIYSVIAAKDGYYASAQKTIIEAQGPPSPIEIALNYAPPTGTWIYQTNFGHLISPGVASVTWHLLTISSTYPFRASEENFTWDCDSGGWFSRSVTVDLGSDTVDDGLNPLQVIGPYEVATANDQTQGWVPEYKATVPNFDAHVAPPGAC